MQSLFKKNHFQGAKPFHAKWAEEGGKSGSWTREKGRDQGHVSIEFLGGPKATKSFGSRTFSLLLDRYSKSIVLNISGGNCFAGAEESP